MEKKEDQPRKKLVSGKSASAANRPSKRSGDDRGDDQRSGDDRGDDRGDDQRSGDDKRSGDDQRSGDDKRSGDDQRGGDDKRGGDDQRDDQRSGDDRGDDQRGGDDRGDDQRGGDDQRDGDQRGDQRGNVTRKDLDETVSKIMKSVDKKFESVFERFNERLDEMQKSTAGDQMNSGSRLPPRQKKTEALAKINKTPSINNMSTPKEFLKFFTYVISRFDKNTSYLNFGDLKLFYEDCGKKDFIAKFKVKHELWWNQSRPAMFYLYFDYDVYKENCNQRSFYTQKTTSVMKAQRTLLTELMMGLGIETCAKLLSNPDNQNCFLFFREPINLASLSKNELYDLYENRKCPYKAACVTFKKKEVWEILKKDRMPQNAEYNDMNLHYVNGFCQKLAQVYNQNAKKNWCRRINADSFWAQVLNFNACDDNQDQEYVTSDDETTPLKKQKKEIKVPQTPVKRNLAKAQPSVQFSAKKLSSGHHEMKEQPLVNKMKEQPLVNKMKMSESSKNYLNESDETENNYASDEYDNTFDYGQMDQEEDPYQNEDDDDQLSAKKNSDNQY